MFVRKFIPVFEFFVASKITIFQNDQIISKIFLKKKAGTRLESTCFIS